jgi:chorismate dehydratase
MLASCDGALLIGDPALYFDGQVSRWDLGQAWRELTGHPFVFAFWAGRADALSAPQVRALQDALVAGQRALPGIAAAWNERAELNESYLRENIVFELGPAELQGLREFYRRAHAAGLIPRIPELRFYAHHS